MAVPYLHYFRKNQRHSQERIFDRKHNFQKRTEDPTRHSMAIRYFLKRTVDRCYTQHELLS